MKKKQEFQRADLLVIYWHDITSVDSWLKITDAENYKPISVVSCGWFLNQDKDSIRLTNTICNDECNVLVIPLAVVDDIKTVEYDRDNDDDEGE
jgi:hypothetical protein